MTFSGKIFWALLFWPITVPLLIAALIIFGRFISRILEPFDGELASAAKSFGLTDLLVQTIIIALGIWLVMSGQASGENYMVIILLASFLLLYQVIRSIIVVWQGFVNNDHLNNFTLLRLVMLILVVGLLLLLVLANRNYWSGQDILPFSQNISFLIPMFFLLTLFEFVAAIGQALNDRFRKQGTGEK
jgi:hypothetical protein